MKTINANTKYFSLQQSQKRETLGGLVQFPLYQVAGWPQPTPASRTGFWPQPTACEHDSLVHYCWPFV